MNQTLTASTDDLSAHVAQSVDELAEIHLAHYRSASGCNGPSIA